MATTETYAYDFDPYGTNPANKIVKEQHVISANTDSDFNIIIPDYAPYYHDSLVVYKVAGDGSEVELVEGVDYYCTHKFTIATEQTRYEIYGSITMVDKDTTGTFRITYQTLGGIYTLDQSTILELLANTLTDPIITTWESLLGVPIYFPPINHLHNIEDMVGMSDVVAKLEEINQSILAGNAQMYQALLEHIQDQENPHRVSAEQTGVDGGGTLIKATAANAAQGTVDSGYMTPYLTTLHWEGIGKAYVDDHINNKNNPHGTTKTHVGLSNVQNYGIASPAQAVDTSNNAAYMTPAMTAVAMESLGTAVTDHIGDKNNPHEVTSEQIGLGNVDNFATADAAEAAAGQAQDRFMTPYGVKVYVSGVLGGFTDHIDDQNNPHRVTAMQVGLGNVQNFGIATDEEALAAEIDTAYMTPRLVGLIIDGKVGSYDQHVADKNNPHEVSASQIGLGNVQNYGVATEADIDSEATDKYLTPSLLSYAIDQIIGNTLTSHIDNKDNPHEVTSDQIGLGNVQNYGIASDVEAIDAGVTDKYMTPATSALMAASVLATFAERTDNPHQVTKAQVGLGNVENYPLATASQVEAGVGDAYVTSANVGQMLNKLRSESATTQMHEINTALFGYGTAGDYGGMYVDATKGMASLVGVYNQTKIISGKLIYNDTWGVPVRTVEVGDSTVLRGKTITNVTNTTQLSFGNNTTANFATLASDAQVNDYVVDGVMTASGTITGTLGVLVGRVKTDTGYRSLYLVKSDGNTQVYESADARNLVSLVMVSENGTVTVIASGNYGLEWPDGVVDDTRGTDSGTTYGSWVDTTPSCHFRVVRTGDVFTCSVSNFGSDSLIEVGQFDLAVLAVDDDSLTPFVGVPVSVGFQVTAANGGTVDVNALPLDRPTVVGAGSWFYWAGETFVEISDAVAKTAVVKEYQLYLSHLPESIGSCYYDEGAGMPVTANLLTCQSFFASSDNITVSGTGTLVDPYVFDLVAEPTVQDVNLPDA